MSLFHKINGYDVICVGETWLSDKYTDNMIHQDGYKIFRHDRQGHLEENHIIKSRGGGLLIYVSDRLAEYSSLLDNNTRCTANLEQMWVIIEHPHMKRQIICTCYRPPNGNSTMCVKELSDNMDHVSENYCAEITVLGDLNMDYRKRNCPNYKLLKDFEKAYGLRQLITKCTRVTARSSTLIDLIFTNVEHVCDSGTLE